MQTLIKDRSTIKLDKLGADKTVIKIGNMYPNIFERNFLFGGSADNISSEEFNNITNFITNYKDFVNTDKKKFILQRIGFLNKIRKNTQFTLPLRFIELFSILESLLSHLGNDSLNKKFRDCFSKLLSNYYQYDLKTLKDEFNAFYEIRSSLVHEGIVDWDENALKKFSNKIKKGDNYGNIMWFFSKLELYTKQILRIYFTKNIEFYFIEIKEIQ